ncbi:MAG: hypothetical protein V2A58_06890 [Planctomycetota bacterium]
MTGESVALPWHAVLVRRRGGSRDEEARRRHRERFDRIIRIETGLKRTQRMGEERFDRITGYILAPWQIRRPRYLSQFLTQGVSVLDKDRSISSNTRKE